MAIPPMVDRSSAVKPPIAHENGESIVQICYGTPQTCKHCFRLGREEPNLNKIEKKRWENVFYVTK